MSKSLVSMRWSWPQRLSSQPKFWLALFQWRRPKIIAWAAAFDHPKNPQGADTILARLDRTDPARGQTLDVRGF